LRHPAGVLVSRSDQSLAQIVDTLPTVFNTPRPASSQAARKFQVIVEVKNAGQDPASRSTYRRRPRHTRTAVLARASTPGVSSPAPNPPASPAGPLKAQLVAELGLSGIGRRRVLGRLRLGENPGAAGFPATSPISAHAPYDE